VLEKKGVKEFAEIGNSEQNRTQNKLEAYLVCSIYVFILRRENIFEDYV
jgi:hypothetical protein